ncbi:MAG: hypothetical protein SVS85_04075 [Candidatus Nanohaloarchaea archaeon]|nr:hypothetical protein [Candidatus Nanohaloarchaea archaeon]
MLVSYTNTGGANKLLQERLGTHKGRIYIIRGEAEPSFNDIQSFYITVFYRKTETRENIQIARIDTSHDETHMDRLFEDPVEKEPLPSTGFWEAYERLKENWEKYARRYEKNHE